MGEMKRDSFGGFKSKPPKEEHNFDYIDEHGKRMYDIFKTFLNHNGLSEMDKNGFLRLYRKRFMVMVDRRGRDSPDTLWMYDPPEDCRDIPNDAVNEWSINAVNQCVLPHLNYVP